MTDKSVIVDTEKEAFEIAVKEGLVVTSIEHYTTIGGTGKYVVKCK